MQNLTDKYISDSPLKEDEYYRKELVLESERDKYFWERHESLTDINLERIDNEKGLAAWISSQYTIDPTNAEQSIHLAKQKVRDYVERKMFPLIAKAKRYKKLKKRLRKREWKQLKKQRQLAKAEIAKRILVLSLIIRNGSDRQKSISGLAQIYSQLQNCTTSAHARNSSKSRTSEIKRAATKKS